MNPGGARRARLHVVTDDDVLTRPDWLEVAASVMDAGQGDLALHLRGPRLPGVVLYGLAGQLSTLADRSGTALVVNDRVDVALSVGVPTVHLGRRSLPVVSVRRLATLARAIDVDGASPVGSAAGMEIGVSCHTPEELEQATVDGADYLFMGTVYGSRSHPGRPAIGPEGLRTGIATGGGTPVIAIGGITPERVAEVVASGAFGVAAVSGIWDSGRPDHAVSKYLSALSEAVRT